MFRETRYTLYQPVTTLCTAYRYSCTAYTAGRSPVRRREFLTRKHVTALFLCSYSVSPTVQLHFYSCTPAGRLEVISHQNDCEQRTDSHAYPPARPRAGPRRSWRRGGRFLASTHARHTLASLGLRAPTRLSFFSLLQLHTSTRAHVAHGLLHT